MSKVANLAFDTRSKKWTATYAGKVLIASMNKQHIIKMIANGNCKRAVQFDVTQVREIGETIENIETGMTEKVEKFGINERFDFLTDFVNMVADRTSPSLVVTGEGGLGKTFTVMKSLKDAGLKNCLDMPPEWATDTLLLPSQSRSIYAVVKGYSTAKGLYRTLYENRNRILVLDDMDSALKDPVSLNLLKGALDSYDVRRISWNAESFGDDDLPRSFEFTGGIIFISNMPMFKIDQAVRSRSICVDLSMTTAQKIERMSAIIKSDEFLPDYNMAAKLEAVKFIGTMQDAAKELSLRTLISVTKIAARGGNWERRAEYMLTAA